MLNNMAYTVEINVFKKHQQFIFINQSQMQKFSID